MSELKPCPFCGGEAKMEREDRSYVRQKDGRWYRANCSKCASGSPLVHETEQAAIEAWNRRSPAPTDVGDDLEPLSSIREDLRPVRLQEAQEAYNAAMPHVRADPTGWLVDGASSLSCYIVSDDGPERINGLLEPINLRNAIGIMRMAAWHCYAQRNAFTTLRERVATLEKAARHIKPYLVYTVGPESPGHHPTMPSAVSEFLNTFDLAHDRARTAIGE